jgi:rRNA maturation endonuclease Nob1
MKHLLDETNNRFAIVCKVCKRLNCDFEFTDTGNLIIFCPACGSTELVRRVK